MHWTELLYYFGWIVLTPCLLVGLWRVAVGPTTLDRMLGFDLLTVTIVALIILFSLHEKTGEFLELILIVSALGFFTTVGFFYYLSHLPALEGDLKTGEDND